MVGVSIKRWGGGLTPSQGGVKSLVCVAHCRPKVSGRLQCLTAVVLQKPRRQYQNYFKHKTARHISLTTHWPSAFKR